MADDLTIARRRLQVDYLYRRGTTNLQQIADTLAANGNVNPNTGEGWDAATISRDIAAVTEEWKKQTAEFRENHQAVSLARLEGLYRELYRDGKLRDALRVLQEINKVQGLYPDPRMRLEVEQRELPDREDPAVAAALEAYKANVD